MAKFLQFTTIPDLNTVWVNAEAVHIVAPAFEAPANGVPAHMAIKKKVGAMLIIPGFAPVAVQGDMDKIAREIEKAASGTIITGSALLGKGN